MASPLPKKKTKKQLNFYEALEEVLKGASVTKKEWGSKDYYGILEHGHLRLHKPDGKSYDWILTDGDLRGDDFHVL